MKLLYLLNCADFWNKSDFSVTLFFPDFHHSRVVSNSVLFRLLVTFWVVLQNTVLINKWPICLLIRNCLPFGLAVATFVTTRVSIFVCHSLTIWFSSALSVSWPYRHASLNSTSRKFCWKVFPTHLSAHRWTVEVFAWCGHLTYLWNLSVKCIVQHGC
jgi:hypothetical protein